MNTLTKTFAKRALSILLVTIMVFSLGIVGLTTTSAANVELAETGANIEFNTIIFFDPSDDWFKDGAWVAAYFYNGNSHNAWAKMTDDEGDGKYSCDVPSKSGISYWENVIFCRMNPASQALSWDSRWNQTGDLAPTNAGENLFTMSGDINNPIGDWSFYGVKLALGETNDTWHDYFSEHTGSSNSYLSTATLEANKTYEFKMVSYGAWYGANITVTENNCVDIQLTDPGDNAKITTTVAGDYVFSFDSVTHKLTVIYPESPFEATVYATAINSPVAQGTPIIVNYDFVGNKDGAVAQDWRLYRVVEGGDPVEYPVVNNNLQCPTADLEPGTYTFYVEADILADGAVNTWASEPFTAVVVAVEEETFTISANDLSVYAGQSTIIKVNSNITDNRVITYHYILNGVTVATNTRNQYQVDTTEDMADTTLVYTIRAEVLSKDGSETLVDEITVNVTVHATSGEGLVTIYFKSAESYGYVPSIKFGTDGAYSEMNKSAVVIGHNNTNTGHYYWYSATTTPVDGKVTFSLTSPRFFKDCTYTLDITKETPQESGGYDYYFAIDNLNLVTSDIVNVTGKEYKDYFNTIIDMITELKPTELAMVGMSFESYAMGDANADGKLNVRDATIIQKDLANITDLSDAGVLVADVTNDGKVTIKDATAIQKQLAGL